MNARGDAFEAARALVLEHGACANAYQILNPGFSHWFASASDAVVGYVRFAGFRVVAGSPVCREDRIDEIVTEFEEDTRRQGLRWCYFGTEASLARRLDESVDRSVLRLGAQPVWDPLRWAEGIRSHASLRAQLHRARNKGVTVREWSAGCPSDATEAANAARSDGTAGAVPANGSADATPGQGMHRCLDEWLSTRGAPPMHFLVEPQTLERLDDRRIFLAERGNDIIGFLVASPVPRRHGWLVEQIIRGHGAVNGTSELLVDAAMQALAASGSRYVTLGLSPLSARSTVGQVPTPLWLRLLLGWLRAHGRRFYNFEGLDAFKAKLGPQHWEPLYAVADRPSFSPLALHAMAGAFTSGSPVLATVRALGWAVGQEGRRLRAPRRG